MNSYLQLLTIIISFLYGIIFLLLTIFNKKIIYNLKSYIKYIISIIFVIDIVLVYIILLYKLNKGYFHIYFILSLFIGYIAAYLFYKYKWCKISVNIKDFIEKHKR